MSSVSSVLIFVLLKLAHALLFITLPTSCILVTFFFTHTLSRSSALLSYQKTMLPQKAEDEALAFIDTYGSYIDIYKCLVIAGESHSRAIVDKIVCLAKYDSHHQEAVKALQRAKTFLFYEPVRSMQLRHATVIHCSRTNPPLYNILQRRCYQPCSTFFPRLRSNPQVISTSSRCSYQHIPICPLGMFVKYLIQSLLLISIRSTSFL